ncbi:phosphomannomutase/phosphoglucomutase [Arenimonas fontis]|uniref:phosphomannomutase n=1 Tax=Arenimonas fontis TaxID=2608255 RepID=A0A5B2ZAN9_9GAMM|nr:phosphomannomutase/phosphoglucomutase [Arenimonas fontis]KAA2284234.1 phosphomannomutase/phosphoglucomutase [Arenimonas fontis]
MKVKGGNALGAIKPAWLLAGLMVLVGLWFAWSAWQAHRLEALAGQAEQMRSQAAGQVGLALQAAVAELEKRRSRPELLSALRRGDQDTATSVMREGWSGVEAVEWHAPDLAEGFADPRAFGYGKLGLLEAALQANAVQIAVLRDGGVKLGLAVPVLDEGQVLGLAYVRLGLETLTSPLQAAALPGTYLALRQGRYNVFEAGDAALAPMAELGAIALPGTNMRVVAAAPAGDAGLGTMSLAGLALLCLATAAGLALLPRLQARRQAGAAAASLEPTPTLGELQASGQLEAQAQAEAEAKAVAEAELAHAAHVAASAPVRAATLDRSIFRAYDIRGIVGQTLDAGTARLIGQAIGTVMHEQGARSIVVGRDGRLSSPEMADALIEGLRNAGREVIDIGLAPTPLVYFGAFHLRSGSCVSVTGSHNPPDYNGFKIVIEGETLSGEAIQGLYARIAENRLHQDPAPGLVSRRDITEDYIQRVAGDIQIERKLRVVVDCGSGVAGVVAPRLLEAIGAEVEPLYCEVDGSFPYHHPDPSDPNNLKDLISVVQRVEADLGLAFDGDGDRLGVVTRGGEMVYPDRLLMLFAADVLERNPGACVIYDVKCTGHLATHILRHGGSPLMWKTGHSLIKAKMRETEAELAGEMSGHFFFRERWYGFDDGLYAAARLLEILSSRGETPEEVFETLPRSTSTPELKIHVEEGQQYAFIEKFVAQAKFEGARIATIDGLRADWPDGWGLVRASNTTPVLVLRFDGKDAEALERIKETFRAQLLAVEPGLQLPF